MKNHQKVLDDLKEEIKMNEKKKQYKKVHFKRTQNVLQRSQRDLQIDVKRTQNTPQVRF
ncbi:hypothetical protein [Bacillus cereus]|uniref:hypothetical protein n=1 Tax=Bacillus cereus TaxID=1396 RepID=UPI00285249AE|nr:hypothetical protein [Bacillus cereus]WLE91152.1 hypothetical protein GGBNIMDK_00183 [Bacillus cereus]